MTEDQAVLAVTSKLVGQLYVGQRVRLDSRGVPGLLSYHDLMADVISINGETVEIKFVDKRPPHGRDTDIFHFSWFEPV